MTLDEAHLVLNVKRGETAEAILKVRMQLLRSQVFFFRCGED
jgi:hypothetical protein